MTPEQFIYWLQGFLEVGSPTEINEQQLNVIKEHIAKVLTYRAAIPNTIPLPYKSPVTWGTGTSGPIDTGHTYC